jgi:diphthine-ammonia ligase
MKDVFVSWSGGKDGTYACYLAKEGGLDICYLLNMPNEDGKRSWTQGLSAPVLKLQSQVMGIPIIPHPTTTAE